MTVYINPSFYSTFPSPPPANPATYIHPSKQVNMPRRPPLRIQKEPRGQSLLRQQIQRSRHLRDEFESREASKEASLSGASSEPKSTHRTWPKQKVPITNPTDIPQEFDWSPNDLDIDEE